MLIEVEKHIVSAAVFGIYAWHPGSHSDQHWLVCDMLIYNNVAGLPREGYALEFKDTFHPRNVSESNKPES